MGKESIAMYKSPFAQTLRGLIGELSKNSKKKESEIIGELSEFIGATRQAISQYRNGIVAPNIEKLCRIADFFNVSTDYLLGKTDFESPKIDNIAINQKLGLSDAAIKRLENYNSKREIAGISESETTIECQHVAMITAVNAILENEKHCGDLLLALAIFLSNGTLSGEVQKNAFGQIAVIPSEIIIKSVLIEINDCLIGIKNALATQD